MFVFGVENPSVEKGQNNPNESSVNDVRDMGGVKGSSDDCQRSLRPATIIVADISMGLVSRPMCVDVVTGCSYVQFVLEWKITLSRVMTYCHLPYIHILYM